jgi:hypothetical protein
MKKYKWTQSVSDSFIKLLIEFSPETDSVLQEEIDEFLYYENNIENVYKFCDHISKSCDNKFIKVLMNVTKYYEV